MLKLKSEGRALKQAIAPCKINMDRLFSLDVDDDIWQDIGLDLDNLDASGNPPLWLCDQDARDGIKAMLELDRCKEEEDRLLHERRSLQQWFAEEWRIIEDALAASGMLLSSNYNRIYGYPVELPDIHHQLQLQSNRLLNLCANWQKPLEPLATGDELPLWGPSADALLNAQVRGVTALVSVDTDDELSDQGSESDEEDEEAGLVDALDAIDLADAYYEEDLPL